MINLGDKLYNKLPSVYRVEDAKIPKNPFPLKRFLQIAGAGMDYLNERIDTYLDLFDLDKCPPELLPYVARMLGFDMSLNLEESQQRSIMKILPQLYQMKGTADAFNYLSREIFGKDSTISSYKNPYVEGMTKDELRKIFVNVKVNGEKANLSVSQGVFTKYAELVRPANSTLIILMSLFYSDTYDRLSKVADSNRTTVLSDKHNIDTRTKIITETLLVERMRELYTEIYGGAHELDNAFWILDSMILGENYLGGRGDLDVLHETYTDMGSFYFRDTVNSDHLTISPETDSYDTTKRLDTTSKSTATNTREESILVTSNCTLVNSFYLMDTAYSGAFSY